LNPSDPKEVVGYSVCGTPQDAETALETVYQGSKTWKKTSPAERIQLLEKLADWMVERKYELSAWMIYEAQWRKYANSR
jgi:delta 1-pyrroline-5-carboxylate dehydrogenase